MGKPADDAITRLNDGHGDAQERDSHTGARLGRDQDSQQQGDASRRCIASEAVAAPGAK